MLSQIDSSIIANISEPEDDLPLYDVFKATMIDGNCRHLNRNWIILVMSQHLKKYLLYKWETN